MIVEENACHIRNIVDWCLDRSGSHQRFNLFQHSLQNLDGRATIRPTFCFSSKGELQQGSHEGLSPKTMGYSLPNSFKPASSPDLVFIMQMLYPLYSKGQLAFLTSKD